MPDNDLLDLSKRGLSKFPVDISEGRDYEEIKRLNLCGNCFQTLEGLARFPALRDIDASFNELHRLACFLSVKATLQQLNVASNQICTADNLNSLEKLQTLNMAGNKLEQFPILDKLVHLRELDLSGNRLTKLPNLSHLPSLVSVSLRELRISSLAEAAKALPNSLQSLDLSFNLIRDLSEALWLSHLRNLESLSFSGNPCVSTDCRAFDYRPYLINCCLNLDTIGSPNLRTIDGFVVSETEQLKGEWLYSQGKGRQFKPGSGKQLAEYLTAVCPLDLSNRPLSTSFDDNLVKVLQKRNQYLNESLTSSGTEYMHDSFSLGHHQKENRAPLSSDRCSSAMMTATPSTVLSPRQESVAEEDNLDVSNESVKNAYDAYDERSAVANFPSSFPALQQQQHDVFHSHGTEKGRRALSPVGRTVSSMLMQSSLLGKKTGGKTGSTLLTKSMTSPKSKTTSFSSWRGKVTPSPGRVASSSSSPVKMTPSSSLPKRMTSSPGKVMSPSSRMTSPAAKVTSPNTKVTSLPSKITLPSTNRPVLTSPSEKMTPKQAWGCANSIDSVRSPLKTPQSAVSAGAVTRRPTLRELRAVCLIQAWWRGVQARTTLRPRLVELKAHRAEQYVSMLMSKVCKLDDNHQKSVQLNKELTEVMEQVVERVKRLEVAMAACLPTPIELGIEKKSDDVAVVRWNLSFPISQVKGYSLFVDGEMCGEVTAANQSAMITDLDFSQPHEIAVQAISSSTGLRSRLSQSVTLLPESGAK